MNSGVQDNNYSIQKLLVLGLGSILLCMSLLLTPFTAYPLILANVLYGRFKGIILSVGCLLAIFLASSFIFQDSFFFVFYFFSLIISISISEIVLRGLKPVRSLIYTGLSLILVVLALVGLTQINSEKSLKELIVEEINKNAMVFEQMKDKVQGAGTISKENIEVISILSEPELLAKQFLEAAPSYLFISVFFLLWANMFLILNAKNYLGNKISDFDVKELISFKMPEQFIWPVIISLVLAIWGESLGGEYLEVIGLTVLKCLGVFYFFQGFGIYLDFLNYAKIKGFFRTFLIVITVFTAGQVVAVLGLFDMFINFRRFFKKN